METESDFTVVVDSSQTPQAGDAPTDFAYCSMADDRALFCQKVWLESVVGAGQSLTDGRAPQGRWIGLINVRAGARDRLAATLETLQARADFDKLGMAALLNALIASGEKIEVQYVHGHWRGVNDLDDFRRAGDSAHGQTPIGQETARD